MTLSEQGLALLKARESCRLTAYRDSVGVLTIGWGDTGDVSEGQTITQAEADERLAARLVGFEDVINGAVTVALLQNQFDSLVSWAYNVGIGAAAHSTLIMDINIGNMDAAASQFDRWHIPPEVTSRRNGEKAQFLGTQFEARIA